MIASATSTASTPKSCLGISNGKAKSVTSCQRMNCMTGWHATCRATASGSGSARRLLTENKPDLFALMLDGTDKIQHQAWHVLDPARWQGSPDDPALRAVRALVISYFRELDGYLRDLHQAAGPDCHLIMVSDHGFAGADRVVRINKYLEQLGLLTWRTADGTDANARARPGELRQSGLDCNAGVLPDAILEWHRHPGAGQRPAPAASPTKTTTSSATN